MNSISDTEQFVGTWVYRSLRNDKVLGTPFNDLRFGEGIIDFTKIAYDQILDSSLDMGGGYILDLRGEVVRDNGVITSLKWRGNGRKSSSTEGWIYDYHALPNYIWDEATDRSVILVGSVLRTVAHGSSPAGVTGTFYMVKVE